MELICLFWRCQFCYYLFNFPRSVAFFRTEFSATTCWANIFSHIFILFVLKAQHLTLQFVVMGFSLKPTIKTLGQLVTGLQLLAIFSESLQHWTETNLQVEFESVFTNENFSNRAMHLCDSQQLAYRGQHWVDNHISSKHD